MAPTTRSSSVVFQMDTIGSWFENIAVRPNGEILTTRLDKPELWLVKPATGVGSVLVTIDGPSSLTGITEVKPDVYAVGGGDYSLEKGPTLGSFGIWIVDLSSSSAAVVREVVRSLPEIGVLNGLTTWDEGSVLAADSALGGIWKIDLAAGGSCRKALDDELMTPSPDFFLPIGVNGVKVRRQGGDGGGPTHVWFTSSGRQVFCRVPVDESCTATGSVEVVGKGFMQDDFCLADDGTAYVTTHSLNTIVEVVVAGDGVGSEAVEVAGDLHSLEIAGGTALAFGRTESDRRTLYICTAGGLAVPVDGTGTEPAKITSVKLD